MSRFREPVNGFTHFAGALLAAGGLIWLILVAQNDTAELLTVMVYGLCTISLYIASAVYHLTRASEYTLLWLRRLDHAAIYLMIAGTYTPIIYHILDGSWRWVMLAVVWGLAAIGVTYKLMFLRDGGWLSTVCYVAMGCAGLVALPQLLQVVTPGLAVLLMMGGICYLIGVVIFGFQKPNFHPLFGHHELWHLLVLGGSIFHFAAILHCFA